LSSPSSWCGVHGSVSPEAEAFPDGMRRITAAWREWQAAFLRRTGKQVDGPPITGASVEYSFWLANPPKIVHGELLLEIGGMNWYTFQAADGWQIDRSERGIRAKVAKLHSFSDSEKYILCRMGQVAYPGEYMQSPDYRWYQAGVATGVTLRPVNADAEFSDMYLTVDGEPRPRGSMEIMDATSFSHPLLMTYEQIDALYRREVPLDWFRWTE